MFFSAVGHNIISFHPSICCQWEHTRARRSHLTRLLHFLFRTQLTTRYTNIWLLTLFSQTAVKMEKHCPEGVPSLSSYHFSTTKNPSLYILPSLDVIPAIKHAFTIYTCEFVFMMLVSFPAVMGAYGRRFDCFLHKPPQNSCCHL